MNIFDGIRLFRIIPQILAFVSHVDFYIFFSFCLYSYTLHKYAAVIVMFISVYKFSVMYIYAKRIVSLFFHQYLIIVIGNQIMRSCILRLVFDWIEFSISLIKYAAIDRFVNDFAYKYITIMLLSYFHIENNTYFTVLLSNGFQLNYTAIRIITMIT